MNKALISIAALSLTGLSRLGMAQHGQLNLMGTDVGHGGSNVYFAGSCLMQFAPDSSGVFGAPFDAYCTVLNVDSFIGSTWGATKLDTTSFVPSPNSGVINSASWPQVGSEIAWLANNYGITNNAEQAAATQLAIWDLAEGGDGTSGDLFFNSSTGEIHSWSFSDSTIPDAQVYAFNAVQAYNSGARAVDDWYQADVIQNQDGSYTHVSQDFVAPAATPEPITLCIGFAGVGLALRRRKKATA